MSAFPLRDCKTGIEWRDSGQYLDKVTTAIFVAAEKELGYPLSLVQGGGKSASSYSATTHVKFGVADIPAWDWENKCEVFASLGTYPYHRPPVAGKWGEHVHIGVIDHPWRDGLLEDQQDDWLHKPPLDGLAGHNVYTAGPHTNGRKIVFQYDPRTEAQVVPMNRVQKARHEIVLAIHNIEDATALLDETVNRPAIDLHLKHLRGIQRDLRKELREMPKK